MASAAVCESSTLISEVDANRKFEGVVLVSLTW